MKHAYLIIAHKNWEQLKILTSLLDDERNDIYIHVDKKAKDFDNDFIKCSKAKVFYIKRKSVSWGGSNMITCEMELLKAAIPRKYARYHLLSGMDLPLKSQYYIHDFFDNNLNEYIGYAKCPQSNYEYRVKYYYLFQNYIGRDTRLFSRLLRKIQNILVKIQQKCQIERKSDAKIYYGSQWFSITNNLAKYIVDNEKQIKKMFGFSHCADELFLQTFAKMSPFADNIVEDDLRYIDWNRGGPYTFGEKDYEELIQQKALFARKFEEKIDEKIILKIANYIEKSS